MVSPWAPALQPYVSSPARAYTVLPRTCLVRIIAGHWIWRYCRRLVSVAARACQVREMLAEPCAMVVSRDAAWTTYDGTY